MTSFNRFLVWSFVSHVIIIIIGGILSTGKKNDFVVFGAYSRYATHTQYKSPRIIPFSNKRLSTTGKAGNKKGKKNRGKKISKPLMHSQKGSIKTSSTKKNGIKGLKTKNKPSKQTASKAGKKRIAELDDPAIEKKSSPNKAIKKKKGPPPPEAEELEDQKPPAIEEEKQPSIQQADHVSETETTIPDTHSDKAPANSEENTGNIANDSSDNGDLGEGFSIDGIDDPDTVAHYQRYVQEEIDRVWRPPLGVKKGTVCTVSFIVDEKGEVQTCTMVKRSPVLIYDLSIMRIARALHFHASLWGKQFKIDFCQ